MSSEQSGNKGKKKGVGKPGHEHGKKLRSMSEVNLRKKEYDASAESDVEVA